jgi:hypothetical protein
MSNAGPYLAGVRYPLFSKSLLTLGVLLLAAATGCGDGRPARVAVSGMVTIDGAPVTRGNIKFVPERGRPSFGEIGPDGRFTLTCYDGKDGAILGKHRVQVDPNRPISEKKMEIFAPKKYADFRTSGLEVVVDKPVDDMKVELTWGNEKKGPYIETLYSGS